MSKEYVMRWRWELVEKDTDAGKAGHRRPFQLPQSQRAEKVIASDKNEAGFTVDKTLEQVCQLIHMNNDQAAETQVQKVKEQLQAALKKEENSTAAIPILNLNG
jgi:hypothetical protein